MDKWFYRISIVLTIIGLLVSIYMTIYKLTDNNSMCLGSGDCSTVNASRYAEVNGIPVAVLGILGYAAILAVLYFERGAKGFLSFRNSDNNHQQDDDAQQIAQAGLDNKARVDRPDVSQLVNANQNDSDEVDAELAWRERGASFFKQNGTLMIFGMALTGFLFTLWLIYAEIFLINALCPFCITSQTAMTLIFILSIIRLVRQPQN